MKKLVIAAVVAFAAIASQAAAITWSLSNAYQPGSTDTRIASGSGLVYLFCAEETGTAAVLAALGDTTTTLAEKQSYLDANSIDSTAMTGSGKVGKDVTWSKAVGSYTFYGVVFADDTVAEGGKYVVTPVSGAVGWDNSSNTAVGLGNLKTLTQDASSWAAVAAKGGGSGVPEPTSGLLVLLGVAGLALRRRRA